jgi:GDP-L-fucose synthase
MDASTKIYVAGHSGLAGSAIVRELVRRGFERISTASHRDLDLEDALATREFLEAEQPEVVFHAAGYVGGIVANNSRPVDFLMRNLRMAQSVIEGAHAVDVQRLIYLGSSCIYPRDATQPLREDQLLAGPLEGTNRPYALAKIAGVEMCWAFNRQFGTRYLAAMPTNLYGTGDNYDLENSHVLPALIRKVHEAKEAGRSGVEIWGSGTPRREFLHADDLAGALVHLAELDAVHFDKLVRPEICPLINVGTGVDLPILEVAELVAEVIGFDGDFVLDRSRPDGTPRKVMDVNRLRTMGWSPRIALRDGLKMAYADFVAGRGRAISAS